MKRWRIVRRLLPYTIVLLLVGAMTVLYVAALITQPQDLGTMYHYNGILFNSFESQRADTEGAIAVGKKSHFGTSGQFDIGAANGGGGHVMGNYNTTNNYPSVLLNHAPKFGSATASSNHYGVYGGPVVISDAYISSYQSSSPRFSVYNGFGAWSAPKGWVDDFFASSLEKATRTGAYLAAANDTNTVTYSQFNPDTWSVPEYAKRAVEVYHNQHLKYQGQVVDNILCVNITEENTFIDINGPYIPATFESYDLIVFNFPNVVSARFTGGSLRVQGEAGVGLDTSCTPNKSFSGNALVSKYASKLVWNFPEAESITIAGHGIVGSVIAPNAKVEANGGSINGMLVADSFKTVNGCELHAFYMNRPIFEFDIDDDSHDFFGDVEIIKYHRSHDGSVDHKDIRLEGAQFQLFRLEGNSRTPYPSPGYVYTTNMSGRIYINDLPEGQYELVEIKAPEGYVITNPAIPFAIDKDNGVFETLKLEVPNQELLADLTFIKTDEFKNTLGASAQSAEFVLYEVVTHLDEDGVSTDTLHEMERFSPDSNGEFVVKDIKIGRYVVAEVSPPDGYSLWDNDWRFLYVEVYQKGNSLAFDWMNIRGDSGTYEPQQFRVSIPNKLDPQYDPALFTLVVEKYADYDTGGNLSNIMLPGAVFELYYHDGTDWVLAGTSGETDRIGQTYFDGLNEGWYKLKEIQTPDGYTSVEETAPFYVPYANSAGKVAPAMAPLVPFPLGYSTQPVEIVRTLGHSGEAQDLDFPPAPSPGVDFGDSATLGHSTPAANPPAADGLPVRRPAGGGISNLAYNFDIVQVKNEPTSGGFRAVKVSSEDHSKTLEGAVFELYRHWGGREMTLIDTLTSDENGVVSMSGLPTGSYFLEEIAPPPGYAISEPSIHRFVIDSAGELVELVIENTPTRGELTVIKINESSQPLEGAEFSLHVYDVNTGEWSPLISSIRSGANGVLDIPNSLPTGLYKLVEERAPAGYMLKEDYGENEIIFSVTPSKVAAAGNGNEFTVGVIRLINLLKPADPSETGEVDRGTRTPGGGSNRIDSDLPPLASITPPRDVTPTPSPPVSDDLSMSTNNPGTGGLAFAMQGLLCLSMMAAGLWLGRKRELAS